MCPPRGRSLGGDFPLRAKGGVAPAEGINPSSAQGVEGWVPLFGGGPLKMFPATHHPIAWLDGGVSY